MKANRLPRDSAEGRAIRKIPLQEEFSVTEQPKPARPKKKQKNQNAVKHGAFSREPMLPGEKRRDYEVLRADLYDEWAPDGPTERGLVDTLVESRWRKQRLDRYEHLSLQKRINQIQSKSEDRRHRQNLRKIWASEFSEATSLEAVEHILSTLSPLYRATITGWVPLETCQDPAQWGAAIGKFLSNLAPEDQMEDSDKFMAILIPDQIEKELDRSDRIDEKIDRTIKRLLQVKLAKQMSGSMRTNPQPEPKLINPPASSDAKHVVEDGKLLMQAEVSVSPAKALNELECPQEWRATDETERHNEVAPAKSGKEHLDTEHVKVEVFAKPELFSIAEMERFFETCDAAYRANEARPEVGGFKLWI
jgi:hypothetical protein